MINAKLVSPDSIQQKTTLLDAIIEPKTKEGHFHLDYDINRWINSPNSVTSLLICKLTRVPYLKRMDKKNI